MEVRVQPTYVSGTAGPVLVRLEILLLQSDGVVHIHMKGPPFNLALANALAEEIRIHCANWHHHR